MKWILDLFSKVRNSARPDGYPRGFGIIGSETDVRFEPVFDPALKQFSNGFREGIPIFAKPEDSTTWHDARHRVIQHVLRTVADSPLRDHLILRGSIMMKHWFGEQARRPNDVDWLVHPTQIGHQAQTIVREFVELISIAPSTDEITLNVRQTRVDDIWTYDRAPGKRVLIPWQLPRLPRGFLQLDFVFEEELWKPEQSVSMHSFSKGLSLLAAGMEQSLAWKILWLSTDMYPQGKDLYDAVLLAESVSVEHELLVTAWTDNGRLELRDFSEDAPMHWPIEDWDDFTSEYPHVMGSIDQWKQRLCTALRPAFVSN